MQIIKIDIILFSNHSRKKIVVPYKILSFFLRVEDQGNYLEVEDVKTRTRSSAWTGVLWIMREVENEDRQRKESQSGSHNQTSGPGCCQ